MKRLIFILITLSFHFACKSQDVLKGKIVNKYGDAIEYANIALLKGDSTYINGCVSDSTGCFQHIKTESAALIRVSYIGYHTSLVSLRDFNGTIILEENVNKLKEVVVKSNRSVFKNTPDGLSVNIQGSPFAALGEAKDILAQLPYLHVDGNKISVIGKGSPIIYVNNRQIMDNNELNGLRSSQIKYIKVITNPGSRFSNDVNAVIFITTIPINKNGLTGLAQWTGRQRTDFSQTGYLTFNYHVKNIDLFASVNYITDHQKQDQQNFILLPTQPNLTNIESVSNQTYQPKHLISSAGINYMSPDGKLSSGIRYNFSKTIGVPFMQNTTNIIISKDKQDNFKTSLEQNSHGYTHYINSYIRNEFRNASILDIDLSYVSSNIKTTLSTQEDGREGELIVSSVTDRKAQLFAERASWTYPSTLFSLTFGNEYTYTDNKQDFNLFGNPLIKTIQSSQNSSHQHALVFFVESQRNWTKYLSTNVGLRYDHVKFDYFLNHERQAMQSKSYSNLMPTISLAYTRDKLSIALYFRSTITRPSYQELRASTSYSNRYSYESGNPSLQPTHKYDAGFRFGYKNLSFSISYNYYKDAISFYKYMNSANEAAISSFTNEDYKLVSASLSYSPKIKWWRPSLTLEGRLPYMRLNEIKYNSPLFIYSLKNLITLPKSYYVTLNIDGNSSGNIMLRKIAPEISVSCSVNKQFGKLLVKLGVDDIFKSKKEAWSIYSNNIFSNKKMKYDSRAVYFTLQYNFNSTKSRYKGGKSGNDERGRL